MGLLSSVVVVAFALSLLVVGDMYDISFFKDISLALVLLVIGTVTFYNLQMTNVCSWVDSVCSSYYFSYFNDNICNWF